MLGALSEPAVERPSSDAGTTVPWAVSYPPMLCAHCASPLPEGSQFCTNCGADVRSPSSSSPASLDDAGVAKLTRVLREDTAGEYEIERELARGGMGVVYLATETQLRRRVAIKVLPPALTFGEGAIERFRREARTAASLDHPNIIPIYRVSPGGELLWYSMKLLEGKSLGTPFYMSPEQYRGAGISGAADQYSLAVVAYQCLGGRVPFEASTAYELLNKHVSEPPPPLAEARPDLPAHAYAAIDRALAKQPANRFTTVT